jgi:hypothetical protein
MNDHKWAVIKAQEVAGDVPAWHDAGLLSRMSLAFVDIQIKTLKEVVEWHKERAARWIEIRDRGGVGHEEATLRALIHLDSVKATENRIEEITS